MNYIFLAFLFVYNLVALLTAPTSCGHNFLNSKNPEKSPSRNLESSNYFANATINAEKARVLNGETPLFSNLRITYDYQFLKSSLLSTSKLDFLKNNIMPTIKNFYQSSVKTFPRQTTIYPSATVCYYSKLIVNPQSMKHGYNDTDMVIFVTGEYNKFGDYIAWASCCNRDADLFNRPLIGLVNINFYYFDWEITGFDSSFKTLAHELFHFMVFSMDHYRYYVSDDGVTLGIDNVVRAVTSSSGTKYKIILNKTVDFGASFYDCLNLTGVWLENNDPQTIGSHWEDTLFRDEMMSPIDRPNQKFSNFSFSLLASSGWYIVNFGTAQEYIFGYKKGCDFLDLACKSIPLFDEYCPVLYAQGCQEDYRGFAFCRENQFTDNACLTMDSDYSLMCNINTNADFLVTVKDQGGDIAADSFCFMSSLAAPTKSYYYASCYRAQCIWSNAYLNYSISVMIGNVSTSCVYNYQVITD